jgi:hypothetical protein
MSYIRSPHFTIIMSQPPNHPVDEEDDDDLNQAINTCQYQTPSKMKWYLAAIIIIALLIILWANGAFN